MKYRKKPLVIDAVQFEGREYDRLQFSDRPAWLENALSTGALAVEDAVMSFQPERIRMTTTHGDNAWAKPSDWIVPETKPGRYYPIAAEIFDATYELLEEQL